MINFIKIWWHCLWNMHNGHRMCKYVYEQRPNPIEWECSCGYPTNN